MIKTSAHLFNNVRDAIRQHHTYELPEIIALPVAAGEEKVLDWITSSVKGGARNEAARAAAAGPLQVLDQVLHVLQPTEIRTSRP